MKTKRAGFRFLKNLALLSTIAVLAVSCGKENRSGQGNNNGIPGINTGINGFNQVGNYNFNGNISPEQALNVVASERPCLEGGQRQLVQAQIQANVNVGSIYFGVSTFGDIAVVHSQNGVAVQDTYVCPRAGQYTQQQPQQITQFILEHSQRCPVSQISYGYSRLVIANAGWDVGWAPIHVPGTDRRSQLCN